MSVFMIEAEMYLGTDSRDELYLIGPYATATDRDAAIERLKALPGNDGDCWFLADTRPLERADHIIDLTPGSGQPDRLDRVTNFDELYDAFEYGEAVP